MLKEKVEGALNKVRPSLQADGGDVVLVDVDDNGVVKVKLQGACAGCPMSQMTLKQGIEKILKQNIPEISRVEAVQQQQTFYTERRQFAYMGTAFFFYIL